VTPQKIDIIGCHIDDRPWYAPKPGNTTGPVAYGGDDDASGCAALLYMAQSFAGQQSIAAYGVGIPGQPFTPLAGDVGDNLDDHGAYWAQGYPAVMLIEDDVNQTGQQRETLGDTISTYNWPFYLAMVQGLVAVAATEAGSAADLSGSAVMSLR
jgi:hypothetical protein